MKKTYMEPTINVVFIEVGNLMVEASQMQVGAKVNSGEAASRNSSWTDED